MDQTSGGEIESSGRVSSTLVVQVSKSIKDNAYASSTSFNVPVTLPTMFRRFKAS
jgi:hypothetical protein